MKLGVDFQDLTNSGSRMAITHPKTGKPIEHDGQAWFLIVKPDDAKEVREVLRKQATKRAIVNRDLPDDEKVLLPTYDELNEVLVASVCGGYITDSKGNEIELNDKNVLSILENENWIRNQLVIWRSDEANFFIEG